MTSKDIFNEFMENHSHLFDPKRSSSTRNDSVTVTDDLIMDFSDACRKLEKCMRNLTEEQLKSVAAAAQAIHRAAYEEMDDRGLWEDDND